MPQLTDVSIPQFTGSLADTDLCHVVDVSDLSGSPQGTSKRALYSDVKDYIEAALSSVFVPLSGGTMTGDLILNANATQALQAVTLQQLESAVIGVYKLQGSYDPTITSLYPAASDTTNPISATVLAGMLWIVSATGTVNGIAVNSGDVLIALIDNPGQTNSNWSIIENNLGYVPLSNVLPQNYMFVGNASNVATAESPTSVKTTLSVKAQETYDNSATGDIALSLSKYVGYSGTTAAFYLNSMSTAQFDALATPPNGAQAWLSDSDRIAVNIGSPALPVREEIAYLSDINAIIVDGAIGECFFNSNAVETIMISTVAPQKVAGTYIAGTLVNFSHLNGRLTNTSSVPLDLKISVSMSVSLAASSGEIEAYIYINGAIQQVNTMQQISVDGVTPSLKTLCLTGFINLNPNDYAEVFILNTTAVNNILVTSLNFSVDTIGASTATGTETLEDAYTAGDGTITQTAGKPLDLISTSLAIEPEYRTTQTNYSASPIIIGKFDSYGKNSVNASINYGTLDFYAQSGADGNEMGKFVLSSYKNGINTPIFYYDAVTNRTVLEGDFWQTLGSTIINQQQSVGEFKVKTLNHSDAFRIDYSTETAKYKIPLFTGKNGDYGVNFTLGTSILATQSYATGVYTPVWQTLEGTNTILSNSLAVGQTVEVDIVGLIVPILTGGTGVLRVSFGSIFSVESQVLNFTATSTIRNFMFKLKITRTGVNSITAAGTGFFENSSAVLKAFEIFIFPGSLFYSAASDTAIDIEWKPTYGVGNGLDLFCNTLNIKQYG